MVLCIDIGNSNIVLGLKNDNEWTTFRLVTNTNLTSDEYYYRIKEFVKVKLDGVAIASVVPSLDRIFKELFRKYYSLEPLFIVPGIKSGMKLKIEEPKSLGADLLCDAVGASIKYSYPVMIVDLGTATKIIVVNENNEYVGGMIALGIERSLEALISSAAKLSHTSLEKPANVVSNSTTTCIQSGLIYGTASMIDGMIERSKKELNFTNCPVVLTGGLSILIKDCLTIKTHYEPNILLDGLYHLYKKNIDGK